jgi:hypothetical protein
VDGIGHGTNVRGCRRPGQITYGPADHEESAGQGALSIKAVFGRDLQKRRPKIRWENSCKIIQPSFATTEPIFNDARYSQFAGLISL